MRIVFLFALLIPALPAQTDLPETKPANVGISIWVREDIFAGLVAHDRDRVETARRKLAAILSASPQSQSALVWMGSAQLQAAVFAHEDKDEATYARLLERGEASFAEAIHTGPAKAGVQAVIGVTWANLADRLPPELRSTAYRRAYDAWKLDRQITGPEFHQKPEHDRGEMLAALAQAALRVGEEKEARQYLREMQSELPGTVFEIRATHWLERPELMRNGPSCQTCHEPGRLVAALAPKPK